MAGEMFEKYLSVVKGSVNEFFKDQSPFEIICLNLLTIISIYVVNYFIKKLCAGGFTQNIWNLIRKIPGVQKAIDKKMKDTTDEISKMLHEGLEGKRFFQKIPEKSWHKDDIVAEVQKYKSFGKFAYDEGFVSGAVYPGNDKVLVDMVQKVFKMTAYTNPLHPDVFPGTRVMEAEIVQMVSEIFHAPSAVGTVTSGGTESIFLVCKAYRDYARAVKGIESPNMVIPITAHAAFDKAAQMLKIEVRHVRFNPTTMKVVVEDMRRAINGNTCMLVGSAPAFPHGCIDDIEKIASLGLMKNIPVHVDCCLGGFLLPFMIRAGYPIQAFDFQVLGVTSISADTHKYAYAPKGTSVILYKEKKYRHHQYSIQSDWPGGIYGTPSIAGSRSGGVIATCWASLLYHGKEVYVESTRKIISVTRYITKGLKEIEGIFVFGDPQVSVIAIGSKKFDIYRLSSALTEKGWNLNALQYPAGFHFCITMLQTYEGVADKFLSHVKECTQDILKNPGEPTTGTAAIYGMASQIPDRSLVKEIVWSYLDSCYNVQEDDKMD